MVMPAGPVMSDQAVIGFMHVGLVSVGVGPVYKTAAGIVASEMLLMTGATSPVKSTLRKKNPSSIEVLKCETRMRTDWLGVSVAETRESRIRPPSPAHAGEASSLQAS